MRSTSLSIALVAFVLWAFSTKTSFAAEFRISPLPITLNSPESSQQLLVTAIKDGRTLDLTRQVTYEVTRPKIATIAADGLIQALTEGFTQIIVQAGNIELRVPVQVTGIKQPSPVSFRHEIIPILTKSGCNSGSCHGKAEGQNGFKLSVFGFDPVADHTALVKERRGGRILIVNPERSLILRKPAGAMPHGGGLRIQPSSLHYRRLRRWIAEGAQLDAGQDDPDQRIKPAIAIDVEPQEQILLAGVMQQLKVTAVDEDANQRCVTVEAHYESNASAIATVDHRGLIQAGDIPGEAVILVRYLGHVAVCRVTLPRPGVRFERPPESNFIDRLVWDKLQQLGIEPSEPAHDTLFLRRVYLDTIGTLPTSAEVREFVTNSVADKHSRLIDQLLERDEYADYWTMRWSDMLRIDQAKISPQGAVAMTRWLRRQLKKNTPYDQFVHAIVTARGNMLAEGPASFFQVLDNPELAGRSVSQLFLGARIECAQCHHHPFEKWSQDDYYAFAGFFTGIARKSVPNGGKKIVLQPGNDLKQPHTDQIVPTAALGAEHADFSAYSDRREALVDWMVAPNNPFFSRVIVNRLWGHYFGRGLVEPIDDIRATNPATNEPLLNALSQHLIDLHFDIKAFTRTLLNSRVYQLSSHSNESNALDNQNFSHAAWKALPAEVLLDAICQATDVPEEFNGWPVGFRAIQIWDNRMPSYFFRIFGRPQRVSVCECERGNDPSIAQALHLMNSPETMRKIRHRNGQARKLADSDMSPQSIVEELYLSTVSRIPTEKERALMMQAFVESGGSRQTAAEDILWVLLNTKEFIYNH